MPQRPYWVATLCPDSLPRLYSIPSEHFNGPKGYGISLAGQDEPGWALAWSPFEIGLLASGAMNGRICTVRRSFFA